LPAASLAACRPVRRRASEFAGTVHTGGHRLAVDLEAVCAQLDRVQLQRGSQLRFR